MPRNYLHLVVLRSFDMSMSRTFKNKFAAERSRQFDVLPSKEAAYQNLDGCSIGASDFLKPGYQLNTGLNFSNKEHKTVFGKLDSVVKALEEHDSTLFCSNTIITFVCFCIGIF